MRRETGRRRGWKSLTMKGRANRIGHESCASAREGRREALTVGPMGQVLSRESSVVRDADAVCEAEGSTVGCANASAPPVPRGLRPWHVGKPLVWEPGGLMPGRAAKGGPHWEGRRAGSSDARA